MGDRRTILVVDDQVVILALIERILARNGYSTIAVQSAAEAISVVENRGDLPPIDLALIDLVMPGEGGQLLAERLRRMQPDLRVLFMSGFVGTSTSDDAPRLQAMILKPFSPETLIGMIRNALDSGTEPGN